MMKMKVYDSSNPPRFLVYYGDELDPCAVFDEYDEALEYCKSEITNGVEVMAILDLVGQSYYTIERE